MPRLSNPPNARPLRWVASRKLAVMRMIDARLLTFEEACRQYHTTAEELASWRARYQAYGPAGLHALPECNISRAYQRAGGAMPLNNALMLFRRTGGPLARLGSAVRTPVSFAAQLPCRL